MSRALLAAAAFALALSAGHRDVSAAGGPLPPQSDDANDWYCADAGPESRTVIVDPTLRVGQCTATSELTRLCREDELAVRRADKTIWCAQTRASEPDQPK